MDCDSNCSSPLQQRFVSEIELERVTGISRRSWQKHRLLNRGPRYYKIHTVVRYDLEEVLGWIRSQAVGATSIPASVGVETLATAGSAGAAA
jgi:hypothetical protein